MRTREKKWTKEKALKAISTKLDNWWNISMLWREFEPLKLVERRRRYNRTLRLRMTPTALVLWIKMTQFYPNLDLVSGSSCLCTKKETKVVLIIWLKKVNNLRRCRIDFDVFFCSFFFFSVTADIFSTLLAFLVCCTFLRLFSISLIVMKSFEISEIRVGRKICLMLKSWKSMRVKRSTKFFKTLKK